MPKGATQLSSPHRHKWLHVGFGIALIAVAVALTVGWQFLGTSEGSREAQTTRWVVYFLGTLLFSLLIGGLVLIVMLLLREVRLNERQANFISSVTHELKTPVASLKLYLDTLQLRDLPEAQREEFYRTMREDIDRLHATINNVLNAAMYTDRPVIDPRPLDLASLVRRAVELTRTRHRLTEEAVAYRGPGSLSLVGDAGALEMAVLNLLDNAVKYSREPVRVEASLESGPGGAACLRVSDQGIGMSRAHLRFVFNRFYRIGSEFRRSRPGIGLGLFIVRSVVAGHKGTVSAESPGLDRGSTFTVVLPGVLAAARAEA